MKQTFLKINKADTVVVCLLPMKKGATLEMDREKVILNDDTPAGHKVLIKDTAKGDNIIKYGYPISHARKDLRAGDWVNEHNLNTNLSGTLTYTYSPVMFTTGRGTPFGSFVPTLKIATNPNIASFKSNWIDFNAGQLIEGRTMEELLPEFIDKIIAVASGELVQNEKN